MYKDIDRELIKAFNKSMRFHKAVASYRAKGYRNAEHLVYGFYYKLYGKNKKWELTEPNLDGWIPLVIKAFSNKGLFRDIKTNCAKMRQQDIARQACAISLAERCLSHYCGNHDREFKVVPNLYLYDSEEKRDGLLFDYEKYLEEAELSLRYKLPSKASKQIKANEELVVRDLERIEEYISRQNRELVPDILEKVAEMVLPEKTEGNSGKSDNEIMSQDNEFIDLDSTISRLSSNDIKGVVAALGYMQQAKSKIKVKSKDVIFEQKGLEVGNDIIRILPEEFSRTPLDFCVNFAEGNLWQTSTVSSKGKKGDFFALFDASGSMRCECNGIVRSAWGKAFVITAAEAVTKTRGRQIHFIPFSGDVWEDSCFTIDGSEAAKNRLLEFHPSGGATDWLNPLACAVRAMREQVKNNKRDIRKKCDVLYITDADGFEYFDVSELKTELNFEIHIVLINDASQKLEDLLLENFADKVINIGKLTSPEAISESVTDLIIDYE